MKKFLTNRVFLNTVVLTLYTFGMEMYKYFRRIKGGRHESKEAFEFSADPGDAGLPVSRRRPGGGAGGAGPGVPAAASERQRSRGGRLSCHLAAEP